MGVHSENNNSKSQDLKRVLYLIQQSGSLMLMPRGHKRHLGNSFDTIASHSYQASVIAYALSRMEGLTHEDGLKCVGMAVFHDLVEARVGDLDFIAKHYVKIDEEKAIKDQFSLTGFEHDLEGMLKEYQAKDTQIAQCARDADSLTQLYTEWALAWQGNKLAQKWFDSDFNDRVPALRTKSASKLASLMKESNPNEWWWSQFMQDDTAIDQEKLLGKP